VTTCRNCGGSGAEPDGRSVGLCGDCKDDWYGPCTNCGADAWHWDAGLLDAKGTYVQQWCHNCLDHAPDEAEGDDLDLHRELVRAGLDSDGRRLAWELVADWDGTTDELVATVRRALHE
jgi:hypothetical protein